MIMISARILGLKSLGIEENKKRLIISMLNEKGIKKIDSMDIRFLACNGISYKFKTYNDISDWLHDLGIHMYNHCRKNHIGELEKAYMKFRKSLLNI